MANCAYYALHELKIRPGVLMGLSPNTEIGINERAFIIAAILIRIEEEKKRKKS